MLQSCVLGLDGFGTVNYCVLFYWKSDYFPRQTQHLQCQSFCRPSFHVCDRQIRDWAAIDPRLWGDWGTPKCSHWPMAIPCLLPISSRLWLVYISVYIEISISFSVQMTLERTKSLRDCHLWVRDWFAVDRRLYLSQARLFWSTPNWPKAFKSGIHQPCTPLQLYYVLGRCSYSSRGTDLVSSVSVPLGGALKK